MNTQFQNYLDLFTCPTKKSQTGHPLKLTDKNRCFRKQHCHEDVRTSPGLKSKHRDVQLGVRLCSRRFVFAAWFLPRTWFF